MPEPRRAVHPVSQPGPTPDDLPSPGMSTGERRYTLDEARALLARAECDRDGHDLEQAIVRLVTGASIVGVITCTRCRATFSEDR